MKRVATIGLIGAIAWLIIDAFGTIMSLIHAINEGWFSYNITSYVIDMAEWVGIASLIFFLITFKNRLKS